MNSSKIFGDVILYLERIIAEGSELDYDEVSGIAMCPAALFGRIFIFVAGVSLSDYVRKRKLTLAGSELKNNGISVTAAAMKYGFGSHSAFTRAFREHHGFPPSEVHSRTAMLNNYLPINFSEMRFIGGKRIMAEMKKITYKQTPERLMAGYHKESSFQEGACMWQEFFAGDIPQKLNALSDFKECGDIDPNDGIGMIFNFKGTENFEAVIGDFVKTGTQIPEGVFTKHTPAGLAAHVQIEGNGIPDIVDSAYMLITEAIEKTGRVIDFDNFYMCEVYTHERYCEPLKRREKVILDYIVPVKQD